MSDYDYLLTIKVPFGAFDDAAARKQAKAFISAWEVLEKDLAIIDKKESKIKLQRILKDKAPVGLEI